MTNNVYSLLMAYFQYQRDLGVDDLVFGRGSEVKTVMYGAIKANAGGQARVFAQQAAAHTPQKSTAGYGEGGDGGALSLSRLAKIRPVDTIKPVRSRSAALAPLSAPKVSSAKREKLAELYREAVNCDKCALSQSRGGKVVFGAGSADGKLFSIANAPSIQDEKAGLPLQGEAGELYRKMLDKMGLGMGEDVFTAYLQKCLSASGGGNELDKECAAICRLILDRQIDIVKPKALLIFGQPAANLLLENAEGIESLRSASHKYKGIPAFVTYDLFLMLKETQYRHGAWEDMKKIINIITG